MKKSLFFFILAIVSTCLANAQYTRFIVQLKDKNGTGHSIAAPSTFLSPKAIERRNKQKINIDSTDLPVTKAYLDSIKAVPNVVVMNVSKWLNQVLIRTTDPSAITKINSFPFVKLTAPIAAQAKPGTEEPINKKFNEIITPIVDRSLLSQPNGGLGTAGTSNLNYGNSFNQVHLHEGEFLHDQGFTGQGITIAVLDAGFFGYKTNNALDSVRLQGRILGEWDYVLNEASVNEDYAHGLYCFSIIASNKPGIIMGSAPHAKFYLFRTEDVATEYPVEEQNWVAAAEYADSVGVDMITSSLGYSDFDDPAFNHTYAQRDGNTSIVTRGADLAARKGIIVTNSAGNTGGSAGDGKFVSCPADGDSVVAVAATTVAGAIAGFSSWGPNGMGTLKPNIASVGQGTVFANTAGNPVSGNGTSFSNPLACGLIACLWQAFPEFTNMEIIDAVQKSSHLYATPDVRFGYGIPNFRKAYEILAQERDARRIADLLGDKFMKAYPNPFQGKFSLVLKAPVDGKATIQLTDANGRIVETKNVEIQAGQVYFLEFYNSVRLARGSYYIRYKDGKNKETIKIVKG